MRIDEETKRTMVVKNWGKGAQDTERVPPRDILDVRHDS